MNPSRRTFLGSGAAGLGLAWGGMNLALPTEVDARETRAGEFIYGTHVYRPPNPPRSMRREALRTIAREHGFGLIRCFPTWDYYNPERDRYDFSEVEEVMKYCDEFGLKVMMGQTGPIGKKTTLSAESGEGIEGGHTKGPEVAPSGL